MLKPDQIQSLKPKFRVMQIICGALVIGPIVAGVLLFVMRDPPRIVQEIDLLAIIIATFAVTIFIAAPIAGMLHLKNLVADLENKEGQKLASGRSSSTDDALAEQKWLDSLLGAMQTSTIVRAAMIEGGTQASILVWLLNGSALLLGTFGLGIALLMLFFPTEGRITAKLEDLQSTTRRNR